MRQHKAKHTTAQSMVITTVALSEEVHAKLRHLAVDARKSLREIIRDAVDDYLKHYGKEAR